MAAELSRRKLLAGGAASAAAAGAAAAGAFGSGWRPSAHRDPQAPATKALTGPERHRPHARSARGGNGMNVVLLIVDTVRADHVGVFGSSVRTPNFDAFAHSGTLFTRAYPEAVPTIPVRRAVHTGLRTFPARDWHHLHGSPNIPGWQPIPNDQIPVAEMLGRVGYTRQLLADTSMLMRPFMDFSRGFTAFGWIRGQKGDHYGLPESVPVRRLKRYLRPHQFGGYDEHTLRRFLANLEGVRRESEWPAPRLYTKAARMLRTLRKHQPFFLVVDTFQPHDPFVSPAHYVRQYSDGPPGRLDPVAPVYGHGGYDRAELDRIDALYSAGVTFTDAWAGRFLDALAGAGLDESTLVVLLSDHGYLLGEHGLTGKPMVGMYPGLTDILLAVRHPEHGHGRRSRINASTHDIAPTVLAALDVHFDGELDGGNMLDPHGVVAHRRHATSMYSSTLWSRDDRWMFVGRSYGAEKELYDLRRDPKARVNVAGKHPQVVKRMLSYVTFDANGHIPHYF